MLNFSVNLLDTSDQSYFFRQEITQKQGIIYYYKGNLLQKAFLPGG